MSTEDWDLDTYREEYKKIQAEQTRAFQSGQEHERKKVEDRMANGELVDASSYWQQVQDWARNDPAAASEWIEQNLGIQASAGSDASSSGSDENKSSWERSGYSEAIFDTESDEHEQFVGNFGNEGFRHAQAEYAKQQILENAGLGDKFTSLEQKLADLERQNQEALAANHELQQTLAQQQQRMQVQQNPKYAEAMQLHQQLKDNPGTYYDIVDKLKKLNELEEQGISDSAGDSFSQGQQMNVLFGADEQPAIPAEQMADRISQSESVGKGSSEEPGSLGSRTLDFKTDGTFRKIALEQLAKQRQL